MNPFEKGNFYKDSDYVNVVGGHIFAIQAEAKKRGFTLTKEQLQQVKSGQKTLDDFAPKGIDEGKVEQVADKTATPTLTTSTQAETTTNIAQAGAQPPAPAGMNTKKLLLYGGGALAAIVVIALLVRNK